MVIWKKIGEFRDFLISSNGKCFSLKTKKMLKPQKYPNGYLFYAFKINGKQYTRLIHRLIAKAFIPNPQNKPQIDHINTIKTDNRIENLRWVNQSENNLNSITRAKRLQTLKNSDKIKHNLRKATEAAAIKNKKQVYQYTLDGKLISIYSSIIEAAKNNNCFPQNITACCKGRKKTVKGYIWRYIPL